MVNFLEASDSGDKSSTEKYLRRTGRWLPYDPEVLEQWLGNTVIQANENPLGFIPAVQALLLNAQVKASVIAEYQVYIK